MEIHNIFEKMDLDRKNSIPLAGGWIQAQNGLFTCWIDGKFQAASPPVDYDSVKCDLDEEVIAEVFEGIGYAETAVKSSSFAQLQWKKETHDLRSDLLYRISKALESKEELFSQLNRHSFGPNDFRAFRTFFEYYSNTLLNDFTKVDPVGVVLVVLSHKSPIWFLSMNVAAALSVGCSVILNPSLKSPFSSFLLAEICSNVGLPNGLINVVPGSKITLEKLMSYNINKIVFNNDYANIDSYCVSAPEKCFSILLMKHTASIILESCDLQGAVDRLFTEIWNCESAWALDLIVVEESIYQLFIEKLKYKLEKCFNEYEISPIFKDAIIRENMLEALSEVKTMGIEVMESSAPEGCWGPAVVVGYHFYSQYSELPIVSVLPSSTPKKAVDIINSMDYCLGTSAWTENWPQALETADELNTSSVWINCHGVLAVDVPLEPLRKSGFGRFGGVTGALDFVNFHDSSVVVNCNVEQKLSFMHEENAEIKAMKPFILELVRNSFDIVSKWKTTSSRKDWLKNIYHSMMNCEELKEYSSIVNYWANAENSYNFVKREENLCVMTNKSAIGVIAILLTEDKDIIPTFISLVSPSIAFGNSLIVLVSEDNYEILSRTLECFHKHIPKGLLNVVRGISLAYALISHPNVHDFWLHCTKNPLLLVNKLKRSSLPNLKRFWVLPPAVPQCITLFSYHCLKDQNIWFSRTNRYPK